MLPNPADICDASSFAERMRAALAALLLAPASAAASPSRLVLALDGAAYHHVRALQDGTEGRRCFTDFPPAARLISTYPSLSDLAWSDILGLIPQRSYQPLHYSYARNELAGAEGFESMGDTPEYARRMDWHLKGSWTNLAGYLFPRRIFRMELARIREAFLASDDRPEFYALLTTLDYAVHMSRDIRGYLCETDAWLAALRREHLSRTGRELEVLILSDHGTDDVPPRRAPAVEHLRRRGFRVAGRLERRGDVVVPVDGMLNTLQAYPLPEDIPAVAAALVELPGVDLVTFALPGRPDEVRVLKTGAEALIRARGGRYAYAPLRGDPLDYADAAAALMRAGKADRGGYAAGEAWLAATSGHRYPAALERIVRGHGGLVLNPAPVIASLLPGHVVADSLTWRLSRIVSLGGTHGALDALSSNGVALSSAGRLPDTTTNRIRGLVGGFTGLKR